ncbi:hypothetical protein NKH32_30950 [Mesorhizobium sp. M1216]
MDLVALDDRIPAVARNALQSLVRQIRDTEQKIAAFNDQILAMAKENQTCRRRMSVLTIGPFASTAFWQPSVIRVISPRADISRLGLVSGPNNTPPPGRSSSRRQLCPEVADSRRPSHGSQRSKRTG